MEQFIGSKEDILYLLIEQYYDELDALVRDKGPMSLESFINKYFHAVDQLGNEINIIYRDFKSLPSIYIDYVQSKEIEFLTYVKKIIIAAHQENHFKFGDDFLLMTARNLIIQGHMWAFRSWEINNQTTLDEYIHFQTIFFTTAIREHLNKVNV